MNGYPLNPLYRFYRKLKSSGGMRKAPETSTLLPYLIVNSRDFLEPTSIDSMYDNRLLTLLWYPAFHGFTELGKFVFRKEILRVVLILMIGSVLAVPHTLYADNSYGYTSLKGVEDIQEFCDQVIKSGTVRIPELHGAPPEVHISGPLQIACHIGV